MLRVRWPMRWSCRRSTMTKHTAAAATAPRSGWYSLPPPAGLPMRAVRSGSNRREKRRTCPRQESGRPPVRCCGRSYIGMTGQQGIRFGRAYPGGRVCPQLRKKYGKMNIRMKRTAGAAVLAAACWSCGAALPASLPERAEVPFEEVYPETGGVPVVIGGYGSAMGYDAADSCFWLLTDRGPNVDGPTPE